MQTESQAIDDQASKAPHSPRLEKPVRISEQLWPAGTLPKLTICCWTFNHAGFLRSTLEGFLMQETTFPVEILIHDDASKDGTAEIVRECRDKYPQLITAILQEKNQFSQSRFAFIGRLFDQARGDFLALCEGDDYWISKDKLERQYTAFEGDPGTVLCLHQAMQFFEATGEMRLYDSMLWNRINLRECLDFHDFTNPYNITPGHTSSALFRKDAICGVWDIVTKTGSFSADLVLFILLLRRGDAVYINDPMSVYRIHAGGVSSRSEHSSSSLFANRIQMYRVLQDALPGQYREQIDGIIALYRKNIWFSRWISLRKRLVAMLPQRLVDRVRQTRRKASGAAPALLS